MGSPTYCYKEFTKEYIRLSSCFSKYEKVYTDDYLNSLSEKELETEAKKFNNNFKEYGFFLAGVAVAHCCERWEDCIDTLNASAAAIGDFFELLNIEEPDDVDFKED